jgi:iron(II)-dependent oxidoreductase
VVRYFHVPFFIDTVTMESATEILERHSSLSAGFGSETLLVLPDGRVLDLATGYIPLLSTFTTEDKAAKGLRKGKESSTPPAYFSLIDLLRDNQALLLSGPSGSGKTTFAKHLCYSIAEQNLVSHNPTVDEVPDVGAAEWGLKGLRSCYFAVDDDQDLEALARDTLPALFAHSSTSEVDRVVVVIDAVENAGRGFSSHIENILTQLLSSPNKRHRLLLLSDAAASSELAVPLTVARHSIKPLSATQRRDKISQWAPAEELVDIASGDSASNPALFALALEAKHPGDQAEVLLDAWLVKTSDADSSIAENAFHQMCREISHASVVEPKPPCFERDLPLLARSRKVKRLLVARHLFNLSTEVAVNFLRQHSIRTAEILQSLLIRLREAHDQKFDVLAQALLKDDDITSQRAALLLAQAGKISAQLEDQISHQALKILKQGRLPFAERQNAASVLSRFGDPRGLAALAEIPASVVTLGSNTHVNSQPMHELLIPAFRIGVYPVTVQQYAAFAAATSRQWVSPDRDDSQKQNFPATDVTWHDAVAYCGWLTSRWRENRTIGEDERVGLPSEPEWEKAASSGRNTLDLSGCLYPWGTEWRSDASNSEETGLNAPCAVGLFPEGASSYGCHDMTGNIWEWCTTLWGEDMTTPAFGYPWQDDGREAAAASPSLRRVLRGGCFSSGRMKANCTYRGSLEPSGYWRGNGFRVVVSRCC